MARFHKIRSFRSRVCRGTGDTSSNNLGRDPYPAFPPDHFATKTGKKSRSAFFLVVALVSLTSAAPLFPPTVHLVGEAPDTISLADWNQSADWLIQSSPDNIRAEIKNGLVVLQAVGEKSPRLGLVHLTDRGGNDLVLPVERRPLTEITFTFSASDSETHRISVAGGFNNWSADANPMKPNPDGTYSCNVGFRPGTYQYKLVVDGNWIPDPANPELVDNGLGGYNSILHLDSGQSDSRFIKQAWSENTLIFRFYPPNAAPPSKLVVLLDGSEVPFTWDQPFLTVRADQGSLIRIVGLDSNGMPLEPCWALLDRGVPMCHPGANSGIYDSFIYCIFPDRFRNGDSSNDGPICDPGLHRMVNYQGGDLAGIQESLEEGYFDSLGINTLWLGPLYPGPAYPAVSPMDYNEEMQSMTVAELESTFAKGSDPYWGSKNLPVNQDEFPIAMKYSGYHGYWPANDRDIEPRFGDIETMKHLVSSAHSRGFRVILDLVPHHVHEDHPWVTDHPDWFQPLMLSDGTLNLRRWDSHRLSTWFDPFLPSLDLSASSLAVESVVASAAWWLTTFSLDGFRHDATKHIPHSFWRSLTTGLNRATGGKEILQIGETFGTRELVGSYVRPAELDGQFDFNLYYASRPLFCGRDGASFRQVVRELEQSIDAYGPLHLMANITGSHDQTRFVTLAQNDIPPGSNEREWGWTHQLTVHDSEAYSRLQLFFLFNLSIPGVPVLYYGDEIGMPGAADPDNRRFMRFGDELDDAETKHLRTMRALATIRKNVKALAFGDLILLHVEDEAMVLARVSFKQTAVVAFNLGPAPWNKEINLAGLPNITDLRRIFGEGQADLTGSSLGLVLPPLSGLVLISPSS